jgi:hypothetical protein
MSCPFGYRLLKHMEIIQPGDLFLSNYTNKWCPVSMVPSRIGTTWILDGGIVPFCKLVVTPKGNRVINDI